MADRSRRTLLALVWAATLAVAAPAQLAAEFSAAPTSGDWPLSVSFTNLTTAQAGYVSLWSFGDGYSSGEQHPTHLYEAPGVYTVELLVIATDGSLANDQVVKPDFVSVSPPAIEPSFTASVTSGTVPLAVQFTDTTPTLPVSAWHWDFGDGVTSNQKSPTHVYLEPGSYDVTLTATVFGEQGALVQPGLVVVEDAPFGSLASPSVTAGRAPLWVNFKAPSEGFQSAHWEFGDGAEWSGLYASHVYEQPGSYVVSMDLELLDNSLQSSVALIHVQHALDLDLASTHDVGSGALDVTPGDVTGDGLVDLVTRHGAGGAVGLVAGELGAAFGAPALTALAATPRALDLGDLDGDGTLEVVVVLGDELHVFAASGDATLVPTSSVATVGGPIVDLDLGDLDEDGALDAILAQRGVGVVPGDGRGGFDAAGRVWPVGDGEVPHRVGQVELGDVDDDGHLDVFARHELQHGLILAATAFTGDGRGELTQAGTAGAQSTAELTVGPMRRIGLAGDGYDDVVWPFTQGGGGGGDGAGVLWIKSGPSGIPNSLGTTPEPGGFELLVTGDVSADGQDDVLLARGDGAGGGLLRLVDISQTALLTFGGGYERELPFTPADVDLADVDQDGLLDILLLHAGEAQLTIFREVVPPVGFALHEGSVEGAAGLPLLSADGSLLPGGAFRLTLQDALPGGMAALVLGLAELGAPFGGGVLVPRPDVVVPGLSLDGAGSWSADVPWPETFAPGFTVWFQVWIADPGAALGLAASPGLSATGEG
jgi:PKD repeat protein